ncbi:MAG: hypothetical protein Q7S66_00090 [bacterium]|nr:hypothetical protein [bacterium]
MKKTTTIIIAVLGLIAVTSIYTNYRSSNIKNLIYLPPKTITVSDDYVSAQGTWLPQNNKENGFFREKEVNTSSIYCYKQTQKCDETRAILGLLESGSNKYGFYTHNFEYKIKEWNANYLKTEMVGAGRVFDLTINLQNKTAVLNVTDNQDNPTASAYTDTAILGN